MKPAESCVLTIRLTFDLQLHNWPTHFVLLTFVLRSFSVWSHTNSLTSGSHHSALNVSLKTPGFITTNATADVLTSRQKYLFFVATNMSGNYPKVLIKTHAFVSPKRPEMSRLPIKNLQLLSPQKQREISRPQDENIIFFDAARLAWDVRTSCPKHPAFVASKYL